MIDHVSIMIVQFSNNHEPFVHPEFNWEIGNILLASLNLSNLFTLNKGKCFSNVKIIIGLWSDLVPILWPQCKQCDYAPIVLWPPWNKGKNRCELKHNKFKDAIQPNSIFVATIMLF